MITSKLKKLSQYRKYLKTDEAVTGKDSSFSIEVKNIGDELFPGGSVELRLERPAGMGSVSKSAGSLEVSALKPNEIDEMTLKAKLGIPGIWVLHVQVNSKDKAKVEYYDAENTQAKDEWTKVHYVFDRHQLDMRHLLEELLKKE